MPDLFISHTPADHELTDALAESLSEQDIHIATEMAELNLGDSLRQIMEKAFQKSKCGIIVLSQAFLRMLWSRRELDSLATMQNQHLLFAIWRDDVSEEEVRRYSESLLQLQKLPAESEWDKLVEAIKDVVGMARPSNPAETQPLNPLISGQQVNIQTGGDFILGDKVQNKYTKAGTLRGSDSPSAMTSMLAYHFSEAELRTLAYQLGLEYDELEGYTKEERAKDLVWQMSRRGAMDKLYNEVSQLRPNAAW